MSDLLTWIAFAVIQLILVAFAGIVAWRRPVEGAATTGVLLIGGALLLGVLNASWWLTGGPDGESAVPMRGGVLGFWLSSVTALEVVGLGAWMLAMGRRRE